MTPAQAIAQALLRCAARAREFEEDNLPRDEPPPLAQRRAGMRVAAREIGEWLEDCAAEYEAKGASN